MASSWRTVGRNQELNPRTSPGFGSLQALRVEDLEKGTQGGRAVLQEASPFLMFDSMYMYVYAENIKRRRDFKYSV